MLMSKLKMGILAMFALVGAAFAYDLKTVELVPVKFQKTPAHAPVRLVENGKLNFAIVADLDAERRMHLSLVFRHPFGDKSSAIS